MPSVSIIRSVGGLVFDATIKEDHEDTSTVTDNPIETGVSVSDHMYRNPIKVTLTAAVSDTPLVADPNDMFTTAATRSLSAYDQMVTLKNAAEPFDVMTGLKLYHNMVCTSVKASQDKDSAGAFLFDADLREVIIVNTQTVTFPPRKAGSTKRQADAVKNNGEQQGTAPPAAKKSLLSKLLGGVGS